MKRLIWLAIAFLLAVLPAEAKSESDGSQAIASGANTISLGGLFSHVIIKLSSASSSVYCTINHGATASSSNFLIDSGGSVSYGLAATPISPTDQINYFGNGTTGTISWIAW